MRVKRSRLSFTSKDAKELSSLMIEHYMDLYNSKYQYKKNNKTSQEQNPH